jgi:hypothetical protein
MGKKVRHTSYYIGCHLSNLNVQIIGFIMIASTLNTILAFLKKAATIVSNAQKSFHKGP